MNRHTAIGLLDRLHKAQNEFYAGGSGAALQQVSGRNGPIRALIARRLVAAMARATRLGDRLVPQVTDDAHADERPSGLPSERRWAVLYDADCGFCTWLLSVLLRWDRASRLHPIALQRSEADHLLQELTPAERMASWHLISPSGERRSGGAAVPPLLRVLPAGRLPAAGLARFPRLTDRGYRWVAEHRSQLSKWVLLSAKERASQCVHQREQDRETH